MNLIINLLITAVAAYLLAYVLPGIHFPGFGSALVFALVLGILNIFVKPILKIFGFPLTIITLGFFSLVINALVIMLAAYFVKTVTIDGFWWAFVFSILLSFVTSLLSSLFTSKD